MLGVLLALRAGTARTQFSAARTSAGVQLSLLLVREESFPATCAHVEGGRG